MDAERLERIQDRVDEWHDAPEGVLDGPLHEALGWTWAEYKTWVEQGDHAVPESREGIY